MAPKDSSDLTFQILLIFALLEGCFSLILHDIDVPPHRVVGDSARLICNFEMEGDILYSVKWYKDDLEFYRFVPNDRPKLQVFPQKGIHVDKSQSSKQQVVLTNLSLETGGAYKCEVSAEAPSFRTKSAVQAMVVVVLPKKADIIGAMPKYQVGDIVNVTCFSHRSRPAASLTWRVNGVEVSPRYDQLLDYPTTRGDQRFIGDRDHRPLIDAQLLEYKPQNEEVTENGVKQNLETSALGLTFRVRKKPCGCWAET